MDEHWNGEFTVREHRDDVRQMRPNCLHVLGILSVGAPDLREWLEKLFKACTPHEVMRFKFYLMSGFRDAEGRFTTWRDVDFKHMAVRVTAKPHWGFHPKNWEEREVPVPQKLITMLQKFRPVNATPDDPLFPSATGRPDGAMLEKLKAVAWRGKLNCGHCAVPQELKDGSIRINRYGEGPFCGRWFLHKFRHFAEFRTMPSAAARSASCACLQINDSA
jgi:integrase